MYVQLMYSIHKKCFQKCFVSVFRMQFVAILTVVLFGFAVISFHTITRGNMGGAHVYAQLQTAAAPHEVLCILFRCTQVQTAWLACHVFIQRSSISSKKAGFIQKTWYENLKIAIVKPQKNIIIEEYSPQATPVPSFINCFNKFLFAASKPPVYNTIVDIKYMCITKVPLV